MLVEMDATGVDRAVIVPPSWIGEDGNQHRPRSRRAPSRPLAVMGRIDPELPGAGEKLETWLQQPHMLGVRMTFQNDHVRWLDDDTLDDFWTRCERLGIPVMCLVPNNAGKLRRVAERHPAQRIIVDHLAANTWKKFPDSLRGQ